ncbi:hypothetical protein HOLleu_45226 [Holothuria leucospilota]|uniref:Uncharacterized protein n=1 Tax=Holothuria leucospilota TaxID=206669 RepID=A0A9Q0YEY5_HOLLE|nr:hypothetical protein HOLleu_45226 [Holothuria leucospilota]
MRYVQMVRDSRSNVRQPAFHRVVGMVSILMYIISHMVYNLSAPRDFLPSFYS